MALQKVIPDTLPAPKVTSSKMSMGQFIGTLFQYRDLAHLAHLKTSSYAQHMALNEFYDGLLDQIDTLTETAQADSLLDITIPASSSTMSTPNIAAEVLSFIAQNRSIFPDSYQQQIIDNIVELAKRTTYKITKLG